MVSARSRPARSEPARPEPDGPAPGPDTWDGVELTPFQRAVIGVLLATEPGDVLSYGDVAAEAGFPGAARGVGNILARAEGLPWWRVVSASGRLIPHNPTEQARRLAAEGVTCRHGRVVAGPPS